MKNRERSSASGLAFAGAAVLGAGLLLGYNQGVSAGLLDALRDEFTISDALFEIITSWMTLGAVFGAVFAGAFSDRFGRRNSSLVAGALCVVGAVLQAVAPGPALIVVGRVVTGLGVGIVSVAAPIYATEMSPANARGRVVAAFQVAIASGVLGSYVADAVLAGQGNWRIALGIPAVLGVAVMLVFASSPPSYRWSARRTEVLASRAGPSNTAGPAIDQRVAGSSGEPDRSAVARRSGWDDILDQRYRRALWLGLGLAMFQQITGIIAVVYYSDRIFNDAGLTGTQTQENAAVLTVGVVLVIATLAAVALIDSAGRRALLISGQVAMAAALAALGTSFLMLKPTQDAVGPTELGTIAIVCLVIYVAGFSLSLGPTVWVLINEIFPPAIRSRAVALCTALNWIFAYLVAQFFLTATDFLGAPITFWGLGAITLVSLVWTATNVPETKGLALEDSSALLVTTLEPSLDQPASHSENDLAASEAGPTERAH